MVDRPLLLIDSRSIRRVWQAKRISVVFDSECQRAKLAANLVEEKKGVHKNGASGNR